MERDCNHFDPLVDAFVIGADFSQELKPKVHRGNKQITICIQQSVNLVISF